MRFWIIPAALILMGIASAFTLSIQGYNYYNNYYWGNPSLSSSTSSSGWSAGVNTGSSFSASSPLELTGSMIWSWGDGTESDFSIDTGDTALDAYQGTYQVNGQTYSTSGNFCGYQQQYNSGTNGYAQTFFTDTYVNGNCVIQETHDYSSTGVFTVQVSESSITGSGSSTLTYVIINAPTLSGSASYSQIDEGNFVAYSATINYGSNTYIAEASDSNGAFFLSPPDSSPSKQSWIETPSVGYYSNGGDTVSAYNPITGSYTSLSFGTLIVYPAIQISSSDMTITQTPAPTNGASYVNSTPIQLTVSIPEQTTDGHTEPSPLLIVSWGDNSQSNVTMSESGGNYVATLSHTYQDSGNYAITANVESYLYVSSGGAIGTKASASKSISVSPYILPTVSIAQPSYNVCQGEVTGVYNLFPSTFTITSTEGSFPIKYFDINWGDGNSNNNIAYSSATQTYSHTYSSSGSYTITIKAYDENGNSATTQVPITVNEFAYPSISISNQNAIATQSQQFSIVVGKGTCNLGTLSYNFGDGTGGSSNGAISSETFTVSHTYKITQGLTSQQYILSGTISDDMGNSVSASGAVTVTYAYPQIGTISPTTVYNSPTGSTYSNTFNVNLQAGTNSLNQITWNFGNGSSPVTNPAQAGTNTQSYAYPNVGSYNLVVTATDSANYYNSTNATITVNQYPYPYISDFQANSTTIYQGIDFQYNATASQDVFDISKIVFNFGDAGSDGDIQTVYTSPSGGDYGVIYEYPQAGNYTATATVYDIYGVSSIETLNVTVIPYQPPILVNFSISNPPNLDNATITTLQSVYNITAIEGSYPINSVQFNWGDGTIQTITNLTFTDVNGINETTLSVPHIYTVPSSSPITYNIMITATDSQGFGHSINRTVTVYPYVNPSVSNFQPTAVIVNNTVYYSVNVTAGTEPLNYTVFNFTEGTHNIVTTIPTNSSGSIRIPIILNQTFGQLGGYIPVSVTVYDTLGNSTTLNSNIYSQALPAINQFEAVPYSVSNPSDSLFVNVPTEFLVNISEETNPLANFTIFFGDGSSQTINNPSSGVPIYVNHTYIASGSYEVQLQVYDAGNSNIAQPNLENSSNEASYSSPMTIFISENSYQIPHANNITPQNVYSVIPNQYNFSIIGGSFNTEYMNVSWGDGNYTYNATVNSLASTNITLSHTYAYSPAQQYQVNATVCDAFNFCSTRSFQVNTTYQVPIINSVSISNPLNTSTVYALVNTSLDFNITVGTFPLSTLSVNFGNGADEQFAINDTNTTIQYSYPSSGAFTLTASAQDTNAQVSNTFITTINVTPYISPQISQLAPTSVTAGLSTNFTATVTQGLFPIQDVQIWWQGLNPDGIAVQNYTSISNGTNVFQFTYGENGTFFVTENITDIMGVTTSNTTIITANQAPWTMSPATQTINYLLENSTPPTAIANFNITFQNVTLPINITAQQTTIAGAYLCYPTISNPNIVNTTYEYQFRVFCTTNPYVASYPSLPINFMITGRTITGITNNILVTLNLTSELPPAQISTPFNPNLYVSQPLSVLPSIPITADEVILLISIITIISIITLYMGLR